MGITRKERTEAKLRNDDEHINPEVYRVEDGHTYEVSPWPSMEGKCHLCGHPETMHMQTQRKVEDLNPWSHD